MVPSDRELGQDGIGSVSMNPYYDRNKTHHTPDGFRDPYVMTVTRTGFGKVLKWRWRARRDGLPPAPRDKTPVVEPDIERLRANAGETQRPSATWIGHSTMFVQSGGLNVITDPIFSERASPAPWIGPKRAVAPGIAPEYLPPVDVVLISHGHYDHLDRRSVRFLADRSKDTIFIAPLGYRRLLGKWGIANVVELDWWESCVVSGVEFMLVPAQHWTARSFRDRNRMLWGGFAVFAPGFNWYFSGDSGYGAHFRETAEHLAARRRDGLLFDLALLAIGAYEPRWFMQPHHMNPADAIMAHRDLGVRQSLAIHWGTFSLTDEALDEPPRALAEARQALGLADADFRALAIGESWWDGVR